MEFSTLSILWLTATGLGLSSFGSGAMRAFAGPDLYEYCEKNRITYFIRISTRIRQLVKVGAKVVLS